jgi:ribonuclease HI
MKDSPVHVWCDGSYRPSHRTGGAGWRIRYPDGEVISDCQPITLRDSFNYGSTIAELEAFSNALEKLEPGLSVHVHTDCLTLMDYVSKRKLPDRMRSVPSLATAFERALAQIDRLDGNVTLEKAADRNNKDLQDVHCLSQKASSPHRR